MNLTQKLNEHVKKDHRMDLESLMYPQFNDNSNNTVKLSKNIGFGPYDVQSKQFLPKKPISNPLYMKDLSNQI
jgi:hypothetical protein